jgi:hypothetical protein
MQRYPKAMTVHYRAVQNIIQARISNASRKHPIDKESVRLWLDFLATDKGYTTLYDVPVDGGPLLVSWFSPWQKSVSCYE